MAWRQWCLLLIVTTAFRGATGQECPLLIPSFREARSEQSTPSTLYLYTTLFDSQCTGNISELEFCYQRGTAADRLFTVLILRPVGNGTFEVVVRTNVSAVPSTDSCTLDPHIGAVERCCTARELEPVIDITEGNVYAIETTETTSILLQFANISRPGSVISAAGVSHDIGNTVSPAAGPLSSVSVAMVRFIAIATPPQRTPVPPETLQIIMDLFSDAEGVRPSQVVSTLQDVFSAGYTFTQNISQSLFNNVSDLIDNIQQGNTDDEDNTTDIGSTLLYVMDRFALGPYDPEQGMLEDTDNIAFVHRTIRSDDPSDEVKGIARNGSRIVLPREVFMNCSAAQISVASYFYHNLSGLLPNSLPGHTQNSNTTMVLASGVLSSALQCGSTQYNVRDLINPVVIGFSHPQEFEQQKGTTSVTCVFWEFDDFFTNGSIGGHWATEGCTRNDTASDEFQTICECTHLTHFGVLFDLKSNLKETFAPLALEVISYIGAGISIISLIIIVGTYCTSKKLRSSEHGQLLVNLSVALIGLHVTFLLGSHVTTVLGLCTLVSALLHYFILVFFGWTLAQAINLYHKLVTVLESPVHHFVLKAALVVWLTPLLIVSISLGPGHTYYANPYYCRPTGYPFWFGLVLPFLLIYLLNWIVFFLIMVSLIKKRSTEPEHKKLAVIAIGLSIIFGLGWGLGLAATSSDVEKVTFAFQVIFGIFVGSQGPLIFIFHGIRSETVRKEWVCQLKKLPGVKHMRSHHYQVSTGNQTPGHKIKSNQTNSGVIMNGSLDKNSTYNV